MATEGDCEIARDRAVQRTSKERPPLHLQNLATLQSVRRLLREGKNLAKALGGRQ